MGDEKKAKKFIMMGTRTGSDRKPECCRDHLNRPNHEGHRPNSNFRCGCEFCLAEIGLGIYWVKPDEHKGPRWGYWKIERRRPEGN